MRYNFLKVVHSCFSNQKLKDIFICFVFSALLFSSALPVYARIATRSLIISGIEQAQPGIQKMMFQKAVSGVCPGSSITLVPLYGEYIFKHYKVSEHATLSGNGCAIDLSFREGIDPNINNKYLSLIYVHNKKSGKVVLSSCISDVLPEYLPEVCLYKK